MIGDHLKNLDRIGSPSHSPRLATPDTPAGQPSESRLRVTGTPDDWNQDLPNSLPTSLPPSLDPSPDGKPAESNTSGASPGGECVTTECQLIERFASWIVGRNLTAPVILFLDMHRPLSFVCSQIVIMFTPFLVFFFTRTEINSLVQILEDREGIERLIIAIEHKDGAS